MTRRDADRDAAVLAAIEAGVSEEDVRSRFGLVAGALSHTLDRARADRALVAAQAGRSLALLLSAVDKGDLEATAAQHAYLAGSVDAM